MTVMISKMRFVHDRKFIFISLALYLRFIRQFWCIFKVWLGQVSIHLWILRCDIHTSYLKRFQRKQKVTRVHFLYCEIVSDFSVPTHAFLFNIVSIDRFSQPKITYDEVLLYIVSSHCRSTAYSTYYNIYLFVLQHGKTFFFSKIK